MAHQGSPQWKVPITLRAIHCWRHHISNNYYTEHLSELIHDNELLRKFSHKSKGSMDTCLSRLYKMTYLGDEVLTHISGLEARACLTLGKPDVLGDAVRSWGQINPHITAIVSITPNFSDKSEKVLHRIRSWSLKLV